MKISSTPGQRTFHYDSNYWRNKIEYNLPGGETGFDTVETKLPTYWNTSFSKICLGMKIDQQLRFIVINMEADSLYSLIADGHYRPTYLGRDTWRSLIGFGTGGPHDDNNTCGIVGDKRDLDNGRKFIKAMGYILVH